MTEPETMPQRSIRSLELSDYDKGYLTLLSQLTTVGVISRVQFSQRFQEIDSRSNYWIRVIEDTETARVIACASLFVELKFVHHCSKAGHIEDVVVNSRYRGEGLGKQIIQDLVQLAQQQGCYKVILDCSEENVGFYERCGLRRKEIQMVQYF